MVYFTGVRWWRSERLTAAILPVEGDPCIVTPFFEEPSVRETLGVPAEVRVWQEDEDPLAHRRRLPADRKLPNRPIGIEENGALFRRRRPRAACCPTRKLVSRQPGRARLPDDQDAAPKSR